MAGKASHVLAFNHQTVRSAKAVDGRQIEYSFAGQRGMKLLVMPSGAASYIFRYDVKIGANRLQRKITIGNRDAMDLGTARKKADDLRRSVEAGGDPAAEKEARAVAITLRQLFAERCAKDTQLAAVTMTGYRHALEFDVFPELGDYPAAAVTPDQIARVLEIVETRTKSQAHRARTALGGTYRWAIKRRLGGIRINPVQGLGFTHQNRPRNRVLSDEELAVFWVALDDGHQSDSIKSIIRLAILTGQRIGQIVGARTSELRDLHGKLPIWHLPAERMKRKDRDQILPLPGKVAKLFQQAIAAGGERTQATGFVFPSNVAMSSKLHGARPPRVPHIHRESASRAVDRLCQRVATKFKTSEPLRAEVPLANFVIHDLRKLCVTRLRELHHTPTDVCDLILHHSPRGVTGSHYDFAVLDGPVRLAMEQWASHVGKVTARV